MSSSVLESVLTTLTYLPDDVLFQIFSYLPLKSVLRLEHLCQRLQLTITRYLSTVKTLNLYSQFTIHDMFRRYDEAVMRIIHPGILKKLLSRCKLVQSIVYIPSCLQASFCEVIAHFDNIQHIQFVDCKDMLTEVQAGDVNVSLGEVCIASSALCNLTSTVTPMCHTYRAVSTLCMEGITVDAQTLSFFSNCIEMSLIRCNLEVKSNSELSTLEFPNLSKFVYMELPGRSASSRVGVVLVKKATRSEKLKVLHVGLSEFSALQVSVSGWKATHLEDFQVVSTGSYSASLQQLRYASIVANLCHLCRATLERISLPSSILIKQFFAQLILTNSHFQQLRTLRVTGIADTKMFLPPGNMVETFSYQEFLKLCPMMSSLSLHSFTGSLMTLMLPPTLTELTLPWDNRLNLEKQRSEIVSTLSLIPQLRYLSILGVEEVDAMLGNRSLEILQPPSLEISIKSLHMFRMANVYIRAIVLRNCTALHSFSIQCCPWLRNINIPVHSLKKVCIYDDYEDYIGNFISYFMASRSVYSVEPTCHVHLQLHSVLNQEADSARREHQSKASNLFSFVKKTCDTYSSVLDCLVLKDNTMHLLEHNSGEHMYPFTEFKGGFASGRSDTEVHTEISRRERVFEGLDRWGKCILGVKALLGSDSKHGSQPLDTFDVTYCEDSFKCATNLAYLETLNSSPYVCQPSGQRNHNPATSGCMVRLAVTAQERHLFSTQCELNWMDFELPHNYYIIICM